MGHPSKDVNSHPLCLHALSLFSHALSLFSHVCPLVIFTCASLTMLNGLYPVKSPTPTAKSTLPTPSTNRAPGWCGPQAEILQGQITQHTTAILAHLSVGQHSNSIRL